METKRFVLTESTEGTPCITGFLEQQEEMMELGSMGATVHQVDSEEKSPRVLDITLTTEYDPAILIEVVIAGYRDSFGSDVTYEEIV